MLNRYFAGIAVLALSACAIGPQDDIEADLRRVGLDAKRAECVGDELGDLLSRRQLRALSEFTGTLGQRERSSAQALAALGNISDPEIAAAVTRASLACAIVR